MTREYYAYFVYYFFEKHGKDIQNAKSSGKFVNDLFTKIYGETIRQYFESEFGENMRMFN